MYARRGLLTGLTVVALFFSAVPSAHATAIVAGFNASVLAPNDDGSTGLVSLGFTNADSNSINFFGVNYSALYVNNNGNVTFTTPLSTYTPFPIITTGLPMMAPFFADVDTRSAGSPVTYGTGTFGGDPAFGVDWENVDYFSSSPTHTNRDSFQLIIVDRSSDTGAAGNFDFIFNYDLIQWQAGEASSSDANGCGGSPARAGYSNGTSNSFELPGSGVNTAFIDSGSCVTSPGADALILNDLNSNVLGRYVFSVRNGVVVGPPPVVPEPTTLVLFGTGALALYRRRRNRP